MLEIIHECCWKSASTENLDQLQCLIIALQIDCISSLAAILCIQCIQGNYISGKAAINCLSEIRLHIISCQRAISTFDDENYDKLNAINAIIEIANVCIAPLHENTDSNEVSSSLLTLELFSACISVIVSCQKTSFKDVDYAAIMTSKTELINSLLDRTCWHSSTIIALCNICCETYQYFDNKQIYELKVQFSISSCVNILLT